MTSEIQAWMARIRASFAFKAGTVLEVGAYDVNGNVRHHFADATSYVGTDMSAGPNVDLVVNNTDLVGTFDLDSFDTVIACEVLEHDAAFWHTVAQLRALLKPGGYLIITTPGIAFPYHAYPRDYWRFTEDSYRDVFFRGMQVLDISTLDNQAGPRLSLAGIAQKPKEG